MRRYPDRTASQFTVFVGGQALASWVPDIVSQDTVPVNVIGCSAWIDPIVSVSPSSVMPTDPFETHAVSWMSIVPVRRVREVRIERVSRVALPSVSSPARDHHLDAPTLHDRPRCILR